MSSVGVLIKKSKCFVREKKSKCPKKNFQSVRKEKKCKCRIPCVRKKKKLKEKFRRKKMFLDEKFFFKVKVAVAEKSYS